MTFWNKIKLGEIATITSSKRIFANEYQTEGIPFYRGKEIIEKHNGNNVSTELYISRQKYEEIKSKFDVPKTGDILLSSVGTLGVPWLVDEEEFYFKDGNLTWLRCNEKVTCEFLYLWLNSPEAKNQINAMCIGSTQKALTIETLKKFVVTLPTLKIQKNIVNVINPIEKKIRVNAEINRNLSEQAKILFKEKFLAIDCIPLNWKEMTLEDVSILSAGGDKPKVVSEIRSEECAVPIYSNGISNEGIYGFTTDAKIINESVTVSARGTIGFVCLRQEPYVPIVRLISVVPKENIMTAKYLYLWLESLHIMGTGTTQQQLTVPDFKKTRIIVPPIQKIREFTDLVNPIYDNILRNKKENEKLSELRDNLLPKLMSGELDVSNLDI